MTNGTRAPLGSEGRRYTSRPSAKRQPQPAGTPEGIYRCINFT